MLRVLFPNHSQKSRRVACGATLMKKVISMDGTKSFLDPKKIYCCQSIETSLKKLIGRDGFVEMLKPMSSVDTDLLNDIWDGRVWKEFQNHCNENYFSNKRNLAGMINVDWFQPYKHSEHSIGVIYMSIINIPRQYRNKWENALVLGIIPGPKEPSLHINTYLDPIIDELEELWDNGISLEENGFLCLYRVAVICVSSDLPATRKCCGFLNYNALQGKTSF